MMNGRRFRIYPKGPQQWRLWLMMEAQRCIRNAKIEEDRLSKWLKERAILSPSFCSSDVSLDEGNKIDQTYERYTTNADIPKVPCQVLRNGVANYVKSVFNHRRNPKKWHRPRPQRENRSLYLTSDLFELREGVLWVGRPKWPVGSIRMKAHRAHGVPASIRILETPGGRWFVSFSFDDGTPEPTPEAALVAEIRAEGQGALEGKILGIDRGVCPVIALSSGEDLGLDAILHGAEVKRLHAVLHSLKQQLARQAEPGSRRRAKTKVKMGKIRDRLRDIRQDAFKKAVHHLVEGPARVFVLEDLHPQALRKAMLAQEPSGRMKGQSPDLRQRVARALLRASLSEFARLLQGKALRAGKLVLFVPPQHTSSTCSACGHQSPANRPTRATFRCVACLQVIDPDVNAARNLAQRGLQTLFQDPPDGQPGVNARGGVGRKGRGTAPKPGPRASKNEKPLHRSNPKEQPHATHNTPGPADHHPPDEEEEEFVWAF